MTKPQNNLLPLQAVASIQGGYAFRRGDGDSDRAIPVIQGRDLDPAGLRIRRNELDHISTTVDVSRFTVKKGDVLFLSRGPRKCAVVLESDHGGAIVSSHMFIVRADSRRVLPGYLAWWLNHPSTQADLEGVARGTSVSFVSLKGFRQLALPVPPLNVQHQIVNVAELSRVENELAATFQELRTEQANGLTLETAMGCESTGSNT